MGPPRRIPQGPNARRYHSVPQRPPGLEIAAWEWREAKEVTFADRHDAGRRLVAGLEDLRGQDDVVVIGIPRGGVIVAAEVARALEAPLSIWVSQKLRAPANPKLAIGSLAEDGEMIVDEEQLEKLRVSASYLVDEVRARRAEVARRADLYRQGHAGVELAGKRVILVDDGLATGATMRAALRGVRRQNPAAIIAAAPVAPQKTVNALVAEGSSVQCLTRPLGFGDIGQFYVQYREVTDEEVMTSLLG